MDMNVGSVKASEMPFDPNVGKAASSQPTLKANLPSSTSGEVKVTADQAKAIANLASQAKYDTNLAILSHFGNLPVDLSSQVARDIDASKLK